MGVYGLLANTVSARTREIGVRVALGARPTQILKQIAGQGMIAAAIGIAFGIAVSAAAAQLIRSLLFGIEPIDPATFLLVLLSVLLVALLAASVPSMRAAKLDATETLTAE